MGKDRDKATRSKSQPSSSTQAAAAAAATTTTTASTATTVGLSSPGNNGYGAAAEAWGGLLSGMTAWLVPGSPLPPNWQAHFRALLKPSPVTKARALEELSSLFRIVAPATAVASPAVSSSVGDEGEMEAAVSCWCEVFSRVAADPDRKVREKACEVMISVLSRSAPSISPCSSPATSSNRLPLLVGSREKAALAQGIAKCLPTWLCVKCDPAREVAERAEQGLALIPEKNRSKVIAACRSDIAQHCHDFITRGAATTTLPSDTGNNSTQEQDEMREHMDRMVISALGALGVLITILQTTTPTTTTTTPTATSSSNDQTVEVLQTVFPEEKSWKMVLANKRTLIRRAAYTFITKLSTSQKAMQQQQPPRPLLEYLNNNGVGSLVLGALAEKEVMAHKAMWECVLTWLSAAGGPAAWPPASQTRKAVLPRLFTGLRDAWYGSCAQSFPCVLPLLSTMPEEIVSAVGFWTDFFTAMWQGIVKTELPSYGLVSLCECAYWAIAHNAANQEVVNYIVSPVLETAVVASFMSMKISGRSCEAAVMNVADVISKLASKSSISVTPLWVCMEKTILTLLCSDSDVKRLPDGVTNVFSPIDCGAQLNAERTILFLQRILNGESSSSAAALTCIQQISQQALQKAMSASGTVAQAEMAISMSRLLNNRSSCATTETIETTLMPWMKQELASRKRLYAITASVLSIIVMGLGFISDDEQKRTKLWMELLTLITQPDLPTRLLVTAVREGAKWMEPKHIDSALVAVVTRCLTPDSPQLEKRAAVALVSAVCGCYTRVSVAIDVDDDTPITNETTQLSSKAIASPVALCEVTELIHMRLAETKDGKDADLNHVRSLMDCARSLLMSSTTATMQHSLLAVALFAKCGSANRIVAKYATELWQSISSHSAKLPDISTLLSQTFLSQTLSSAQTNEFAPDIIQQQLSLLLVNTPHLVDSQHLVTSIISRVSTASKKLSPSLSPFLDYSSTSITPPISTMYGASINSPPQWTAENWEFAKGLHLLVVLIRLMPEMKCVVLTESVLIEFAVGLVFSDTASMPVWLKGVLTDFWSSVIQPFIATSSVDLTERVWISCLGLIKSCGNPFALALHRHLLLPEQLPLKVMTETLQTSLCSTDATTLQYSDNILALFQTLMLTIPRDVLVSNAAATALKDSLLAETCAAKSAPEIILRSVSFIRLAPQLSLSERSAAICGLSPHVTRHLDLAVSVLLLFASTTDYPQLSTAVWTAGFKACLSVLGHSLKDRDVGSYHARTLALNFLESAMQWFWGGSAGVDTLPAGLLEASSQFRYDSCVAVAQLLDVHSAVFSTNFCAATAFVSALSSSVNHLCGALGTAITSQEKYSQVEQTLFTALKSDNLVAQKCAFLIISESLKQFARSSSAATTETTPQRATVPATTQAAAAAANDDESPSPDWKEELVFVEPLPCGVTELLINNISGTAPGRCSKVGHLLSWAVLHCVIPCLKTLQAKSAVLTHIKATTIAQHMSLLITHLAAVKDTQPSLGETPPFPQSSDKTGRASLASWLFLRALMHMPGLVRSWWSSSSLDRASRVAFEAHIKLASPLVIHRELDSVLSTTTKTSGDDGSSTFTIKVSRAAGQITLHYERDDVILEVEVTLPEDSYPLELARVECTRKEGGINEQLWRRWQLGLACLITSSSSLHDACMAWKQGLDKHFAGIEVCPICYSVFASRGRLPDMQCRTCKKLFHSTCMYKWFSTSHNTSCPLCKSDFAVHI